MTLFEQFLVYSSVPSCKIKVGLKRFLEAQCVFQTYFSLELALPLGMSDDGIMEVAVRLSSSGDCSRRRPTNQGRLFIHLQYRVCWDISLLRLLQIRSEPRRTPSAASVVGLTLGCCNSEALRLCLVLSSLEAGPGTKVLYQASSIIFEYMWPLSGTLIATHTESRDKVWD